jgi:hypothetical protein
MATASERRANRGVVVGDHAGPVDVRVGEAEFDSLRRPISPRVAAHQRALIADRPASTYVCRRRSCKSFQSRTSHGRRCRTSRALLLAVGLAQNVAQTIQSVFPAPSLLGHPSLCGSHHRRFYPTNPSPPDLSRLHESARLQDLDVLDDGGKRHRERFRELTDRGRPSRESFHHRTPALIGEGLKCPVQIKVKHSLKYRWLRRP